MKSTKITLIAVAVLASLMFSGCATSQRYDDLLLKNRTQQQRIAELESQLSSLRIQYQNTFDQLNQSQQTGSVDIQSLREEIAALEEAMARKNALIAKMQKQLLSSGTPLPMELNIMLSDFASSHSDFVSFDESTGMLKFKSDLLFAPGSDIVESKPAKAIAQLAKIINDGKAADFDIVVAGHTDDVKIGKPSTRRKHPTNWHLSAHRAISVVKLLSSDGVAAERLSARGFGQYRPIAPNKKNHGGNPANRRVEIFIVPKGM